MSRDKHRGTDILIYLVREGVGVTLWFVRFETEKNWKRRRRRRRREEGGSAGITASSPPPLSYPPPLLTPFGRESDHQNKNPSGKNWRMKKNSLLPFFAFPLVRNRYRVREKHHSCHSSSSSFSSSSSGTAAEKREHSTEHRLRI